MNEIVMLILLLIAATMCLIMIITDIIVLSKIEKRIKRFNELFKEEDLK